MGPELLMFVQVAGAAVSAIGAMRQGEAQATAATFNAQVNAQNAQIARTNADAQAQQAARDDYLRLGAISAAAGASGGDTGQGSVLDVIGDVAGQQELQKQNILYQGELKARGFTNTATLDTTSAQTATDSSYWKAGSELLGGAVKAYDTYGKMTPTRAG